MSVIASPGMQAEPSEPRAAPPRPGEPRRLPIAFAVCSLASLLVLWTPKYLPLTDLPQHVAQIAIWKHLDEPAYGFREVFEVQLATPYLLASALARLLAEVFPALVSVKLVLTLAVLGLPLSLWRLLRATGGDPFWALAGFPLAFGYAFLWGFFSYVVAIPLGVAYWAFVTDYQARPSRWRAVGLAAFTTLLFGAHLLVFALCGLGAAALLAFSAKDLKTALSRLAPLAVGPLLAVAWASRYRAPDARSSDSLRYGFERLLELPALLLGYPQDALGLLVGALLIVLFAVSGVRFTSRRERWLPLAIVLVAFFATPHDYANVAFLYPRLAILIAPAAIVATERTRPPVRPAVVHTALVATALGWLCLVWSNFWAFDRDARQFEVVMDAMLPKQRVRSLIFERGSEYTPGGVPFLHFPVYYQVEKGGTMSFSFATSSLSVVVFRPEKRRVVRASIDWLPSSFDVKREQDDYDYYVVRASADLRSQLFQGATRRIELTAQRGLWWLYRRGEPLPVSEGAPG